MSRPAARYRYWVRELPLGTCSRCKRKGQVNYLGEPLPHRFFLSTFPFEVECLRR